MVYISKLIVFLLEGTLLNNVSGSKARARLELYNKSIVITLKVN